MFWLFVSDVGFLLALYDLREHASLSPRSFGISFDKISRRKLTTTHSLQPTLQIQCPPPSNQAFQHIHNASFRSPLEVKSNRSESSWNWILSTAPKRANPSSACAHPQKRRRPELPSPVTGDANSIASFPDSWCSVETLNALTARADTVRCMARTFATNT